MCACLYVTMCVDRERWVKDETKGLGEKRNNKYSRIHPTQWEQIIKDI